MGKLTEKLMPYSYKLALLNLMRNGRRSLLSITIISIAVFAMVSAGGFGLYTYESLKESTARETGHLTISQPGYFEQDEEMPLSNGLTASEHLIPQIMKDERVRSVQPRVYLSGLVSNGNKSTIFMGIGVNDREFDMKGPFLNVIEGKTLSNVESTRFDPAEPEIMLGSDLARNLNVSVGDWLTLLATTSDGALNAFDFKVRGIYSTGIPELDKRQLYIHIQSAQELLVSEKVSTLSVFLFETKFTAPVQEALTTQLGDVSQQGLEITPWEDRAFFYKKVKDLYDRIFGIMGIVMGLVVFVSLFNTMTMSVTERTREIGTLSALGCYPREIVAGFLRESVILATAGALIGTILSGLATLLLLVVDIEMPPPPGHTEGYPLNIYFSLELAAYAGAAVIIICFIAAFISARKGVNRPITEALIYV
ncbi:ABC transporter permease [Vibrio tapetis subsp. quintayensis]|uniref:ABC transporter permease n=1 Tax=Vibrio tapetis TaxID=52443 RepID=UPI0025B3E8ED|nr:FtsX-like permease family protein [Vibrio tapetis]MDN3681279.1 ABC transporter permease [Vibrio tapetis subsp. quintayensis]